MMMDSLADGIIGVTCGGEKGSGFPERANKVVNTCGREKHTLVDTSSTWVVRGTRIRACQSRKGMKRGFAHSEASASSMTLEFEIRVKIKCDSLPRVA